MSIAMSFDLGTTAFKAALFDENGRVLALAVRPTPIEQPHERWRQVQPTQFIESIRELVRTLGEQDALALGTVDAISFATQTNSFLLLDERDQPLTPIVLWNDRRADGLAERIDAWWRDTGSYAETGIPRMGCGFAVAKTLWWRGEDPTLWKHAAKLRLIGDWLTLWLTGRHVTEAGSTGLTGLLDIHRLGWRIDALAALDLQHLDFPLPQYLGADLGPIRPAVARQLGLSPACRMFLGGLDQYAGAIGAGNTVVGGISETTGTVLATVRLSDRFDPTLLQRGVFQGPAWRAGSYWQMLFGGVSANLFEALRRDEAPDASYDSLIDEARRASTENEAVRLDRASSLREGRPIFQGCGERHGRGHRVHAVLEAVSQALREQVEGLCQVAPPLQVRSVGGAARSDYWLQLKADTLRLPVAAMECAEPTCLGAAAVALAGRQRTPLADVAARLARPSRHFSPSV